MLNFFRKSKVETIENKTENFTKLSNFPKNMTIDTLRLNKISTIKDYQQHKNNIHNFLNDMDKIFYNDKGGVDAAKQGKFLEEFIHSLYTLAGYKAELTPIDDKGVDVIVTDNNNNTLLIQCKNYSLKAESPKLVGEAEIRNFNGVTLKGEKMFITTSFFTGNVNKDEFPDITFIDRFGLHLLLMKLIPEYYTYYLTYDYKYDNNTRRCDRCWNGAMILRTTKTKEKFYGCSRYPNCKNRKKYK